MGAEARPGAQGKHQVQVCGSPITPFTTSAHAPTWSSRRVLAWPLERSRQGKETVLPWVTKRGLRPVRPSLPLPGHAAPW